MSTYRWRFTLDKPRPFVGEMLSRWHTVTLDHPFAGPLTVVVDGHEVHKVDASPGSMSIPFKVEDKPCVITVASEIESFGGVASMQSWTHELRVAGELMKVI